jgi:hypothetical protein
VLEVGAADRRRPLRAERDALPLAALERVHLLLDDVGRLPDPAGEQLGRLERGRLDAPVSGAGEDGAGLGFQALARERRVSQHVERAAGCLELRH